MSQHNRATNRGHKYSNESIVNNKRETGNIFRAKKHVPAFCWSPPSRSLRHRPRHDGFLPATPSGPESPTCRFASLSPPAASRRIFSIADSNYRYPAARWRRATLRSENPGKNRSERRRTIQSAEAERRATESFYATWNGIRYQWRGAIWRTKLTIWPPACPPSRRHSRHRARPVAQRAGSF